MMLLLLLAGFWAIINCKHQGCAGEQAHAHPSLKQMHYNLYGMEEKNMEEGLSRRTFLKAAAVGTMTLAAMGKMGSLTAMAESGDSGATVVAGFDGKTKFAGVHNIRMVNDDLVYLGVSDRRLELFENVYPIPRGISYNSYLLLDEQTVLFDTVDRSVNG